ncbi:cupin domain-containing protein [Parathalassolituus penaei]|uniref:Cupin domain-containing protein n=1 Tax=Parathalassolituus penaei TaxID=2997323 RepID=A0A9X3EB09_9GAMM|nr:cupin domain-containing protein [Parathalassolituus penaei]MCY0963930.1 cupin domain-containing protein [Parathalassolituus penaei]
MPMIHYAEAIKTQQPSMNRPGANAWLGDVSASHDDDKPIVSGFFRMEKSEVPLVYYYHYHEMKVIVEGEMIISDETGQEVHAKVGDVFYFEKGSTITFNSPSYGIGFFCGQRREGEG